jgi:hypothetical protein
VEVIRMAEISFALHALALVLALVLLAGHLRRVRRGLGLRLLGVAVLLAVAGGEIDFPDMVAVPAAEDTVALQEGGTEQNIEQIYGLGVHAGPLFGDLQRLAPGAGPPDLRRQVWLNRWLAALGILLFPVVAWFASGSFLLALVLGRVFAMGMLAHHMGLSELPAALTALQFWLGALAAWRLDQGLVRRAAGEAVSRLQMAVAVALLILVTALAAGTRLELAGLGVVALTVVALRGVLGDAALRRVDRWPGALWEALRTRWAALALAAGAAAAGVLVLGLSRRIGSPEIQWVVTGLNPLHLGILQLPIFLTTVLPLVFAVLLVLGFLHGVRRWRAFFGLPLAVLLLWGVYHRASHEAPREAFRYLCLIIPPLLLLVAVGWRELSDLAARRSWGRGWERPALLAMILLALVPPGHGRAGLFGLPRAETDGYRALPISMDLQREVRGLLALRDGHPDCLVAAPVTRSRGGPERGQAHRLVLFHPDWAAPERLAGDDGLGEALRRAGTDACVLLYLGLDCNLAEAEGCERYLEPGMERVGEQVFPAAMYNDELEWGGTRAEVRLRVFRVR